MGKIKEYYHEEIRQEYGTTNYTADYLDWLLRSKGETPPSKKQDDLQGSISQEISKTEIK